MVDRVAGQLEVQVKLNFDLFVCNPYTKYSSAVYSRHYLGHAFWCPLICFLAACLQFSQRMSFALTWEEGLEVSRHFDDCRNV